MSGRHRLLKVLLKGGFIVLLSVAITAALGSQVSAQVVEEAPTGKLIAAGLAFALPTYAVGVIAHEGSHALAAKMVGAKVKQFSIIPGRYGPKKNFFFGYVRVTGLKTTRQRSFFWLAPKLTDLVLLGGFSALALTDNLPTNRYGALALTVFATGFWIDFSKDIISTRRSNDVVKTYNANGKTGELSRFPFRLAHAALSIGAGYAVYRGFEHVFETRSGDAEGAAAATILPLITGAF